MSKYHWNTTKPSGTITIHKAYINYSTLVVFEMPNYCKWKIKPHEKLKGSLQGTEINVDEAKEAVIARYEYLISRL